MTLQEAIEEVKRDHEKNGDWSGDEIAHFGKADPADEAIATILNAVVKGELK